MTQISTFVFFDIETTGLPFQENNRTKITELCLLAVSRRDIEIADISQPVSKLNLVLNPGRKIHPKAEMLTGLTNEYLKHAPKFGQKCNLIIDFLNKLTKPVCLVAHNGNRFDYKILLAECNDVGITLPDDLLCVDTLNGFRKLLNGHSKIENSLKTKDGDTLTVDEDMWPELNVSFEDWQEIDDVCTSLTNISCCSQDSVFDHPVVEQENKLDEIKENQDLEQKRNAMIENIFGGSSKSGKGGKSKNKKIKYVNTALSKSEVTTKRSTMKQGELKLSRLYERLLKKDLANAHRAEGDCIALLECVTAMKDDFLPWMDDACKMLTEITPLIRY